LIGICESDMGCGGGGGGDEEHSCVTRRGT
jgi:hypothetical protein